MTDDWLKSTGKLEVVVVNVADLRDPNDPEGRTYRQVNASLEHSIPLGALVELESGERLYVRRLTRDCDSTPLYSLGLLDSEGGEHHGYDCGSLKVIRLSSASVSA